MTIVMFTCLDRRLLLTLTKPLTKAIIANTRINDNLDIITINITIICQVQLMIMMIIIIIFINNNYSNTI